MSLAATGQSALSGTRTSPWSAAHGRSSAFDGLATFTPMWAIAMTFSLVSTPVALGGYRGWFLLAAGWIALGVIVLTLIRPRATLLLGVIAGSLALQYIQQLPVASNNKTIAFVMNGAILAVLAHTYLGGARGPALRDAVYERLRVVARALLAVMYVFGIFHKINTDFLDPNVSCAVALYTPLAQPFGLGDSLYGKYLAIAATFAVEAVCIVSLYWRRFFAVGLIGGLVFHYVIPISAYSWYMDFSSLAFALYVLSIPREVAESFSRVIAAGFRPLRRLLGEPFGALAVVVSGAALLTLAVAVVMALSLSYPARPSMMLYHSVWVLVWPVVGGIVMVALTHAALDHLPYRGPPAPRQPLWLYAFPAVLFLTCLSPYVGLKTESSIAMFSNLHTEGGVTNHLLFDKPPYLFDYQSDVVAVLDSSHPRLQEFARKGEHMVMFELRAYLRKRPGEWVTYRRGDVVHERVTGEALAAEPRPGLLERKFLIFKPVDYSRPKVCTH
jgi:hypothetical protein